MIDGLVIDCRLNDLALAGMAAMFQFLSCLNQPHRAFVSKNQREALKVPAMQLGVRRTLLHELDKRCADSRSIHAGQRNLGLLVASHDAPQGR
jgi:hypothetical protein